MRKMRVKGLVNKTSIVFPMNITIRHSQPGSSLMVVKNLAELKEYVTGRDVGLCEISFMKVLRGTTYVEANSLAYLNEI